MLSPVHANFDWLRLVNVNQMLIDTSHLSQEKRRRLCADLQNEECEVKHKESFGLTKYPRIVFALLPTGLGKSMIYTIFALASQNMRSAKTCALYRTGNIVPTAEIASLGYTVLEQESDNGPALCHIFQLKPKKMSPRTPQVAQAPWEP